MAGNPVVLVHGWSATGASFGTWERILREAGRDVRTCTYRSLTNEVTIRDLAEGFDRALRAEAGLEGDQPFDAVVHSTGMLVVRAWAVRYAQRRGRLKRLIGLAPATNGSALAHKGRSWLGAAFKGNRAWGPDFMEAGDRILEGLELASPFTWDLAHEDLFGQTAMYGPAATTPWVFIFCGTRGYGGWAGLMHDEGSDGTVRLAGAGLDSRKMVIDLTRLPDGGRDELVRPKGVDAPVQLVAGVNHSTILSAPPAVLIRQVIAALAVDSRAGWEAWHKGAARAFRSVRDGVDQWQQFVVRCIDERRDPITDYNVQLLRLTGQGRLRRVRGFDLHVHANRADPSLRCFHVNLTRLWNRGPQALRLRMMASSGSALVRYCGVGSEPLESMSAVGAGWNAELDLSTYLGRRGFAFFHPFTTTFLEIRLNREPWPFDARLKNRICWFGNAPP